VECCHGLDDPVILGVILGLIIIILTVLALFVPYLPRIVARIGGTQPTRERLTCGEDD
jgi:putative tricarboxylic transport membrane protein